MEDETAFKNMEYNSKSVYSFSGKRIFYHEIFKNPPVDLADSILRMVPNINMESIKKLIDETEYINEQRKQYYLKSINLRYQEIILPALKKITDIQNEIDDLDIDI